MTAVELDASNCITIRESRINGPDVIVTVTDLDRLILDLLAARVSQEIADGRSGSQAAAALDGVAMQLAEHR